MVYVKASKRAKAYHRANPRPSLRKLIKKGSKQERTYKLANKLTGAWYQSRRASIKKRFDYVGQLIKKYNVRGFK